MGVFARVFIEEGIDIPKYEHEDPADIIWQSKRGIDKYSGPYKLTTDGRLKRKEKKFEEKTEKEKKKEAENNGFVSWEEYKDSIQDSGLEERIENGYPVLPPSNKKCVDEWWADHNMHGTFIFYNCIENVYYSYEARFTRGDLEKIILLDKHKINNKES